MEIYEIFSCAEFLEMEVDDATMRHIPTFFWGKCYINGLVVIFPIL